MQKNALMRTWRVRRGKSLCPCDRSCRLSTAVLANCDLSEFSWTSCTCGFPTSSNIWFQTSKTLFDPRCFRRKSTKTHTELLKPRVSGSSNNMGQYGVFDILAFYFFSSKFLWKSGLKNAWNDHFHPTLHSFPIAAKNQPTSQWPRPRAKNTVTTCIFEKGEDRQV